MLLILCVSWGRLGWKLFRVFSRIVNLVWVVLGLLESGFSRMCC